MSAISALRSSSLFFVASCLFVSFRVFVFYLGYVSLRAPLGVRLIVGGEAFSCAASEGKSQDFLVGRRAVREVAGEGVEDRIVCGGVLSVHAHGTGGK